MLVIGSVLDRERSRRGVEYHRTGRATFRQSRKYHDGELRHRIVRVGGVDFDRVGEVPYVYSTTRQIMDQIQSVADCAAEAVEGVHDDHVGVV